MKNKLFPPKSILFALFAALFASVWPPSALAFVPAHNVAAGNLIVTQNDTNNNNSSVSTAFALSVNDLQVRPGGNSRGDFGIQVGGDPSDDTANGVVIGSVSQNGRDNSEFFFPGTNNAVGFMAPVAGGYLLCSQILLAGATAGNDPEWNVNMAGGEFPLFQFVGGLCLHFLGGEGGPGRNQITFF